MLTEIIYKLVYSKRQPKSAEEIAEECGFSNPSSFRKAVDPDNDQYNFPAERLIPLMRSTNDDSPLIYMAERMGYLCVRFDRARRGNCDRLAELQELTGRAMGILTRMYSENQISRDNYKVLYDATCEMTSHLKAAQRVVKGQMEFDL